MTHKLTVTAGIEYFGKATPTASAWTEAGKTLSFEAVDERSTRAAHGLRRRGVREGDYVAMVLDNHLRSPEVIAGIVKAGAVIVPVNTRSTVAELDDILQRCGAAAVVTESSHADTVGATLASVPPDRVLSVDASPHIPSWDTMVEESPASPVAFFPNELDTFCVSFTGGTTGHPKGVMLNHRSRALTFHFMALDFGLGPGRRTINATPLYHGAGMAYGYGFLSSGSHVQTMRKWDPEHLLQLVADHRPHQLFLVPSQLSDLRSMGVGRMREAGFHDIATAFTTAAPLPNDLKEWFVTEFPEIVFADVYGGTEAGVVTVLKTPELAKRVRCAGPPWFMTEVRLLDDAGHDVEPGQPGELYSRSPYVFNGYLNDLEQTRAVMTEDGFVTANDVAVQDDDGFLYIVDRTKDMIISGGINIYPREIEEAILTHPAVADASVVGVDHERWGEEVVAVVVPVEGADIDFLHLRNHCGDTLARFKVPKHFLVRSSLDRTVTGKAQKEDLRTWATQQLQDG